MSRLTRYHDKGLLTENGGYYEPDKSNYLDITEKLGKFEDIEDELGCPLDVVTSKTAMVVKDNGIYEVDIMAVSFTNGNIYFGSEWSFTTKKIKDYKKTWWLKEDLSE